MNDKEQKPAPKALSREDRIILAHSYFGWYTFGMAVTESEKIDENVAMDNGGVPFYEDQLTDQHKEVLAKHKSGIWGLPSEVLAGIITGPKETTSSGGVLPVVLPALMSMVHTVPVALDDEGAKALSAILNQRRVGTRIVPSNDKDKRYEVYSWFPVNEQDGMIKETFPLSQHASQDEADKAAEIRIAHLVYADVLLFQMQQAARMKHPTN